MNFCKLLKSRISPLIQNTRGQSMVEFAVALPTVVLLLWAGMYMGDMYIVKHKTLAAARYGTWKLAREEKTVAEIKNNIAKYYFDDNTSGLHVTEQSTPTDVKNVGDLYDVASNWALNILNGIMTDQDSNITSLKIQYEMAPKLGALDISDMHSANYKVESSHYVTANSWDGCHSDVHDLFSAIWELVEEIFTEITGIDFDL